MSNSISGTPPVQNILISNRKSIWLHSREPKLIKKYLNKNQKRQKSLNKANLKIDKDNI